MTYKPRTYRQRVNPEGLVTFEVIEKETDLLISADKALEREARAAILTYRREIADVIKKVPSFRTSLSPIELEIDVPNIASDMVKSSCAAGVGPMAAVAGAIAEYVGRDLLRDSREVIVENGGDIFMLTLRPRTIGVFAGDRSPFAGKLAIEIPPSPEGIGICTSSGTVSHSLSFGKADAALIMAKNAALADAVATATGNRVKAAEDVGNAIDFARSVNGVTGALIIIGEKMGSWGAIKLV